MVYYALAPGIRARREEFGLLFYNSRDTKLTFVKSGDIFEVSPDREGRVCLALATETDRPAHLLHILKEKGLISDTRPCL